MNKLTILIIICCIMVCSAIPADTLAINFSPQLNLSEVYSDNLYLSNTNRQHDFITILSPGIAFEIVGNQKRVDLIYSPACSLYDRFKKNNTLRQDAQLSGSLQLTRYTKFEIEDTFLRTEDPVQEEDVLTRRNREPYNANAALLKVTNQFGESEELSISFEHDLLENEDPAIEDNQSYASSIGLTKEIADNISLEGNCRYLKGEYDASDNFNNYDALLRLNRQFNSYFSVYLQYTQSIRDYDGYSENYTIYEPSIGFSYTINDDTHVTIGAGYYYQNWDVREDDKYLSVNSDVQVMWNFRSGTISFVGSSGFQQEDFGTERLGIDIYHSARLTGEYNLSRHFQYSISGVLRRDEYTGIDSLSGDESINTNPNRIDIYAMATTGFVYQLNDWVTTRLNYSFREVFSNLDEYEYQENRVLLQVTLAKIRH